jgi:EamA domain-containing membrane protein RarD
LKTIGSFLDPLLAIAGMLLMADNLRAVFWLAVVPAKITVLILASGAKEPEIRCTVQQAFLV